MKTIQEKASEYTDSTDTRVFGCEETLDATELIQQAYITGANEALAGQWRSVDNELPDERDDNVLVVHKSYGILEAEVAYYFHKKWHTTNGERIEPILWMPIPDFTKLTNQWQ